MLPITFDKTKRDKTLAERGLDFVDAALVFDGPTATLEDTRKVYGEPRYQTMGLLRGRAVMVVWTPRKTSRRVISMRYAHEDEAQAFGLG